ncbi:multi-sensor hybrid histidine kinase [Calothrix sp. NIES-4071]|nr:multi-sensor hybrid histidine kinase [Calothrix sp. NIES-4071]BAZ63662.1 multi-sensor hybrid histidine kinase [Calothrix sp. NIES-4105]
MLEIINEAQDKFSHFDLIPLGLCIFKSDYIVIYWNSCLEEWTKIPRELILGTSLTERFPHLNQPQYASRLQQIFNGGPPAIFSSQLHKYTIPAPSTQGKNRIQHTTVTSLSGIDGENSCALMSIQDVTDLTHRLHQYRTMRDLALAEAIERKLAQESAEAANRIKDEFLAILSHELRTPLNPILGWSKLLKTGNLDQKSKNLAIETIERNAKLQVQLIDDLLDVSRILRGKLKLDFAPVDLAYVVRAALETVRLAAEAKSMQLTTEINPNIGKVLGDINRLQQIVTNLLTNAVKFTPTGGQVTISVKQIDEQVQLQVTDTGKGIKPEFLPYIFEYFRQADSGTTRKFGGLGLGLAISRHLVELHGGTIMAESCGEGLGATFTCCFPVVAVTVPQIKQELNEVTSLAGINLLAIDDEPDNLELISFVLEQYGATVTTVNSGAAALETIQSSQPDVVISDIGMPVMDGYELIRQIRALPEYQNKSIPAIALTAYGTDTDHQKILEAGYKYHITKPLDFDELVRAVTQLCNP